MSQLKTAMRSRRALAVAAIAALTSTGTLLGNDYQLVYDLRVRGTGGKTATVSALGDVVVMDLYAVVMGKDGNPANDGFGMGIGSFVSSTGGLLGDLLGLPPVAPFTGIGSTPGGQFDVDGDGDLDVAGPNPRNTAGFYTFTHIPNFYMGQPQGGFRVGQVQFTPFSFEGNTTEIRWVPYTGDPFMHQYTIDGVRMTPANITGYVGVAAPVTISYGGTVVPPGETTYLSGTIDEHMTVSGVVKPEPGSTLILRRGIEVLEGGTFDTRDASGNFGPHVVHVDNVISGNNGGTMFAGDVRVGSSAVGKFTVTGGLTRINQLKIGASLGSNGTVQQSGGILQVMDPVMIGTGIVASLEHGFGLFEQSGGSSTLAGFQIARFGIVEISGNAQLNITGEVTINGGALRQSGGTSSFGSDLRIGTDLPATVEITCGSVSLQKLQLIRGSTVTQSGGTVTAGSRFDIGSNSTIGHSTYTLSNGQLNISAFKLVENGRFIQMGGHFFQSAFNAMVIEASAGSGQRGVELQGGTMRIPQLWLSGRFAQSGGTNHVSYFYIFPGGKYEYSGGFLTIGSQAEVKGVLDFKGSSAVLSVDPDAFVDFAGGTLANGQQAGIIAGRGSLLTFPSGFNPQTDLGFLQTEGLVHVAGQNLHVAQGQSISGSGTIIGDVDNEGLISPGNSAGIIEIQGGLAHLTAGKVLIEIGGIVADEYDQLIVHGPVSLTGELEVVLLNGFIPAPNDQFTVLAGGTLTGRFANAMNHLEIAGGSVDVIYTPAGVILANFNVIPEPASSISLLGMLMAGLLPRWRRSIREY